jgi:hypothetical protein
VDPGWGSFFEAIAFEIGAHDFVIMGEGCAVCVELSIHAESESKKEQEKKPGPKEPGLGIGHVRPTQSPSKRDH